MMRRFICNGFIALCALAFVGCQAMTGKTVGQTVSDASITAAVQSKLTADKTSNFPRIDVDTERGVVSLNGVVKSITDKEEAGRIALQVSGVRRVNNNLQIQSQPSGS